MTPTRTGWSAHTSTPPLRPFDALEEVLDFGICGSSARALAIP